MSRNFFDDSSALSGRSHSRLSGRETNGAKWWTGEVVTPVGIVAVYRETKFLRLDFALDDRMYMRNFRDQWVSDRGVAILAGRFAREIAERF